MSSKPAVTFMIADLIDPILILKDALNELPAQELPELPVFSLFLSRGKLLSPEHYDHTHYNLYSCLFKHLNVPSPFSTLPIASSSFLFDNKNFSDAFNNKWIMRLDPCFMVPDRDQLVLAKTGNLDLSLQEPGSLLRKLNNFMGNMSRIISGQLKCFLLIAGI